MLLEKKPGGLGQDRGLVRPPAKEKAGVTNAHFLKGKRSGFLGVTFVLMVATFLRKQLTVSRSRYANVAQRA